MKVKVKVMKNEYKLLGVLLIIAVLLTIAMPVDAAEVNDFGNAWVYDEADVVSDTTENYIASLNETVFIEYNRKPQLAVIVLNKLPYNIESYKRDMFNEFGVGTAEENCGMLFVLAIEDREYALEIGDGFEKSGTLRSALETDFITDSMKDSLRAENYDAVIYQVANHLATMMEDDQNGFYPIRENHVEPAVNPEQMEALGKNVLLCITICGSAVTAFAVGSVLFDAIKRKKIMNALFDRYDAQMRAMPDPDKAYKEMFKANKNTGTHLLEIGFIETLYGIYLKQMDAFVEGKAEAALAASLFHFKELEIKQVKEYLRNEGISVRL